MVAATGDRPPAICPVHDEMKQRLDERWNNFYTHQEGINSDLYEKYEELLAANATLRGASSMLKFVVSILSIILGGGIIAEIVKLLIQHGGSK
jgi:hypothetical protein